MADPTIKNIGADYTATDYRNNFVQMKTAPSDFATADATLIFSTYPFLPKGLNPSDSEIILYPVGIAQQVAYNEGVNQQFIPEIGSERKVGVSGTAIVSGQINRLQVHGPSLLTSLYYPSIIFYASTQIGHKTIMDKVQGSDNLDWIKGVVGSLKDLAAATPSQVSQTLMANGSLSSLLYRLPFGLVVIKMTAGQRVLSIDYLQQGFINGGQDAVGAGQFQLAEAFSFTAEMKRPLQSIAGFRLSEAAAVGMPDSVVAK